MCRELPLIYQAEQHLKVLQTQLQRLALKQADEWEALSVFMHNAAARLEKRAVHQAEATEPLSPPAPVIRVAAPVDQAAAPQQSAVSPPINLVRPAIPTWRWRSFAAGVVTTLVLGGAGLWGWQVTHPRFNPLPVEASEQSLAELGQLPPLWLQQYGFALAAQAPVPKSGTLNAQWQHHIAANALPPEALSGWHEGMAGLRVLTAKLNALDERKGKYLTASELKSMVFAITQNFERSEPVEEQLYSLGQTPAGKPLPPIGLSQTDRHLYQLLNRYMLIKQQAAASGHSS